MRLHLLGLPHTVTNEDHSHCAFTGKILRFPRMMLPYDYEIIHYGVEGAELTSNVQGVDIMSQDEQNVLRGHDGSNLAKFYADDCNVETPLYKEFNRRLRKELRARVTQADLVLLPFGHAHQDAVVDMPYTMIEHGIGYPVLYNGSKFRMFESNAWMHWHHGKADRFGKNYEWVIPNYYDVSEWKFQPSPYTDLIVFLGRICDDKGLPTVVEIAKRRPDLRFIICGQGDPTLYLEKASNITYLPPIKGRIRSMLLGSARCVLMPTLFNEPFGGVCAEAQLCGTPVLSTTYGAFTETIEDRVTGFRCHTLGDFLAALDRTLELDRRYISNRARRLWGYDAVGPMYARAFQQIADLEGEGWFSPRSFFQMPIGPRLVPESLQPQPRLQASTPD